MAKKIYDIVPPKMAHKVENTVRGMGKAPRKKKVAVIKSTPKKIERKFPIGWIFGGVLVVVLLAGAYAFIKLPKADIAIWPTLETLAVQLSVKADKSITAVDASSNSIPALYVESQNTASQDFPATGSASDEGKAQGTVTVYNKISPATPLVLKAGTHFLSDSGKYFVSLDRITVPAMQGKTAGSLTVKVAAEESGPEYNIGASKFSIPKLSGTSYFYTVWAESSSAMSGGYTGKIKKVTNADIANAKDTLTKKALADAQSDLRKKIDSSYVLLDAAISHQVLQADSSVAAGTVADTFTESAKVTVSALVFKKDDLQALVKSSISSQLSADTDYLGDQLDINYTMDSANTQTGVENITVKASAKTYSSIDLISLETMAGGKSADEIKNSVSGEYGQKISQVSVSLWPFWVHKAPANASRITASLRFK